MLEQPTTFTATLAAGQGQTYAWSFGNGASAVSGRNVVSYTYPVAGTYQAAVTATNVLGSLSAATTVLVSGTVTPTTTSLTSAPNPSAYGQSVTFTATVTAAVGVPDGVVTFTVDGAAAPRSLAGGVATYVTSTLAGGAHAVTATYGGDPDHLPSAAGPLTQTVNRIASTTTLAFGPNPSTYGQAVTLTATVASGVGVPTGVVTFTVGSAVVTRTLNAGGVATYVTTHPGGGQPRGRGGVRRRRQLRGQRRRGRDADGEPGGDDDGADVGAEPVDVRAERDLHGDGVVGGGWGAGAERDRDVHGGRRRGDAAAEREWGGDPGDDDAAHRQSLHRRGVWRRQQLRRERVGPAGAEREPGRQRDGVDVGAEPVHVGPERDPHGDGDVGIGRSGGPDRQRDVRGGRRRGDAAAGERRGDGRDRARSPSAATASARGTAAIPTTPAATATCSRTAFWTHLSPAWLPPNSSPTMLGQTTFFTATAAGSNIVYAWAFGDNSAGVAGSNASHVYPAAGSYTAWVTATNGVSQVAAATPVTITAANQLQYLPLILKNYASP